MSGLSALRIDVVGAGVFGLVAAWRLAAHGAAVTLHDPTSVLDSASAVAAGMLAPALETLLDQLGAAHFPLFRQAQGAWPALLAALGVDTGPDSGALFLAEGDEAGPLVDRALAAGIAVRPLSRSEARAMAPGVAAVGQWLHLPGDGRLDPRAVLTALERAFLTAGGVRSRQRVFADAQGRLATEDGPLASDRIIVTAGAEAVALAAAAPELAALRPIKGQILHLAGGPVAGPVIRSRRVYIAPQAGGAVVGATMEYGLSDRTIDEAAIARLRADAAELLPALATAPGRGLAGVRAGTPDGLPLVGPSRGDPRVLMAVGARRNGWLLAPLVAEQLAAQVAGKAAPEIGFDLSPARFD